MNLLTIKCDTKSWKIQIENVKYIISDVEDSFDLLQALRLFTAKEKSEYRKIYFHPYLLMRKKSKQKVTCL